MLWDNERQKLFNRRTAMLAGGKLLLFSVLVGRMYYLQVIESARYRTLADENRINLRLLPPPRGRIVDRFGVPIAFNQQTYRVVVIPEQTRKLEETLEALGSIIQLGPAERRRIFRDVKRKRSFVPVTIRENLTWSEVAKLEINTPDFPGVMIDVGQSRNYPFGDTMAHVLGYVAPVSEGEAKGDALLQLPGFRIGKAGAERTYDRELRGSGGSSQVEVNAFGRMIRELERQEGQPGSELGLTVDVELQQLAIRRLGAESASAVVLDVHNGDILVMVSTPSFDPNAFNTGLSTTEWDALVKNERAPLTNKCISGQYPPGSTFKMAVALAALELGVMPPTTKVHCSGSLKLGNAKFHCWKKGGHGLVDMEAAITQSCDVYFYELAKRIGIDRIGAMARRLGLGDRLGIDLPSEQPGLVPTRAWKKKAIGSSWQLGDTLIAGIGQGYLLATPLQLAVMTARIVNGGRAVRPRINRDIPLSDDGSRQPGEEFDALGFSPENLDLIRRATGAVVNNEYGTAFRARIRKEAFRMGGKSGTAQVRRITKSERETGVRKNKDIAWRMRDHALFVAYAPIDAPRYVAAVVVEHGGGGSAVAAPIARDILTEAQRRNSARRVPRGPVAASGNVRSPGDGGGGA
jgi:penicillin-binding protein 2